MSESDAPICANTIGIGSPPLSFNVAVSPPLPSIQSTDGSAVVGFDLVKRWLSNKPLRIRVMDDPSTADRISNLAEEWIKHRPRGADIQQMVEAPAYQAIIELGYKAVRPLLLMLLRQPEHWFYALHTITGDNPVPPEAEGHISEMAGAWIKWGRERGYVRELD